MNHVWSKIMQSFLADKVLKVRIAEIWKLVLCCLVNSCLIVKFHYKQYDADGKLIYFTTFTQHCINCTLTKKGSCHLLHQRNSANKSTLRLKEFKGVTIPVTWMPLCMDCLPSLMPLILHYWMWSQLVLKKTYRSCLKMK